MDNVRKYLTPNDLQSILQIGKNKAYDLCKLKGFPAVKLGGEYIIVASELDKWMIDNLGTQIFLK